MCMYQVLRCFSGFVNKAIGTTQREASDTTQVRSTDETNQTDRFQLYRSGTGTTLVAVDKRTHVEMTA